jgi:hypothetical protein
MIRLINGNALIELINGGYDLDFDEVPETKRELIRMIMEQPTVDAVPVRHGKWCEGTECYSDDFIVCSVCGEAFNVMDNDTYRFDYCPHCGARMDKE